MERAPINVNRYFPYIVFIFFLLFLSSSHAAQFLLHQFPDADLDALRFVAILITLVFTFVKLLGDANENSTHNLIFGLAFFLTLSAPIATFILLNGASSNEQHEVLFFLLVAVTGLLLPFIMSTRHADSAELSYLLSLVLCTLGATAVCFGVLYLLIDWVSDLFLKPSTVQSIHQSLIVSPLLVGIGATTAAAIIFAPIHQNKKLCTLTRNPKKWRNCYLLATVLVTLAYGSLFTPNIVTSSSQYPAVLGAVVTSALLLAPILAACIHQCFFNLENCVPGNISLEIIGLITGTLAALLALQLVPISEKFGPNNGAYFVTIHAIVGAMSMCIYSIVIELMQKYPWIWLNKVTEALKR